MTVEQFYDGPCWLTRAFRKAHRRRREIDSFNAYLQGAYTYRAIQSNAQFFNPYIKNPKAEPWPDKPLDIFGDGDQEQKISREERGRKVEKSKGLVYFETYMSRHNAVIDMRRREAGSDKD